MRELVDPMITAQQQELFSVRDPAELCRGPVGKKCYFSSFEAAQHYIDEKLGEYKNYALNIIFIPIKTEIDGVPQALWGVYIDEYLRCEGVDDDF